MATSTTREYTLDKSSLVTYVERPGQRFALHYGEGFRYEALPVGTRVIYPPPALPSLPDVDGAIEEALENPMGCPPLSAQLKPDMKVTIAFDDISPTSACPFTGTACCRKTFSRVNWCTGSVAPAAMPVKP